MSYCVECGVKLAESEKVCPLCNTRVINPNHPDDIAAERPYPNSVELQMRGLNRRELAWIVFMFLLLPVGATVIIDLLTGSEPFRLGWSIFVIGAGVLLGIWTLMPIIFNKASVYLHVGLDFLAVAGYLAVIAWQINDWSWCLYLGIPIVLATALAVCAMIAVVRSGRLKPLTRAACTCIVIGFYIVALELIIDYTTIGIPTIKWSIYAFVPLLFVSLLLFYISRKPRLMDELKRRLFV